MKNKWLLGGMAVVAVIGLSEFASVKYRAFRDHQELEHEITLAHGEGMPTSWQEYSAGILTAKPEENAAPLYKSLVKLLKNDKGDASQLDIDLYRDSGAASLNATQREIEKRQPILDTVDRAAKLPRCWFNRDWTRGAAVLMPEYAYMKSGAKWLALRGSISAAKGDSSKAIHDIDEVFVVGRHAGEEGTLISVLVSEAISAIGLHHLALWAFSHRGHPEYLASLKAHLNDWLVPDVAFVNRGSYLELRDILTLSTSPEGRKELGLKEEDVAPAEKLVPLLMSRPKADIKIARGMRQVWEAYKLPPNQRLAKVDAAWETVLPSLLAYPTGSGVYIKLTGGGGDGNGVTDASFVLADLLAKGRKLTYEALVPILELPSIPQTTQLKQLASPFDGKPPTVQFDGKQIVITVSCPNEDAKVTPLKLPTDKELGRTAKRP